MAATARQVRRRTIGLVAIFIALQVMASDLYGKVASMVSELAIRLLPKILELAG